MNDPALEGGFRFWLGATYLNMRKYVQAREALERGISLLERSRLIPSTLNGLRLALALVKTSCGDVDIEMEPLYRYQAANKMKYMEGLLRRYLSAILLDLDAKHLSQAEDLIKRAIEDDTRNGTRFSLAEDFAHYAELCKRKGDLVMAKEKLSKAIEIFKECGSDGWVKRYEEELARL